jgi:putative aldouronate transport system permease protein
MESKNKLFQANATVKKKLLKIAGSFRRYWFLYILIAPGVFALAIFAYVPMLFQVIMAFTNYTFRHGIFGSPFVGIANFDYVFNSMHNFGRIFANTMMFSLLDFIFGFFPPLILAVMLFDLFSPIFRKVAQTVLYIPYFFSWVIIYSIAYGLLSNTGILNSFITAFGGASKDFLTNPSAIRPILYITSTWKGIGWGTIIYLAAMQSIDASLYEAAKIDGCGPWRRIFSITLPGIKGIIMYLMIFTFGGIFNGGNTEQILLFYNPAVASKSQTVGIWLYEVLGDLDSFSYGAALSFVQSTLGMVLVIVANTFMSKKQGVSIW